jgi:hypothetical protein
MTQLVLRAECGIERTDGRVWSIRATRGSDRPQCCTSINSAVFAIHRAEHSHRTDEGRGADALNSASVQITPTWIRNAGSEREVSTAAVRVRPLGERLGCLPADARRGWLLAPLEGVESIAVARTASRANGECPISDAPESSSPYLQTQWCKHLNIDGEQCPLIGYLRPARGGVTHMERLRLRCPHRGGSGAVLLHFAPPRP